MGVSVGPCSAPWQQHPKGCQWLGALCLWVPSQKWAFLGMFHPLTSMENFRAGWKEIARGMEESLCSRVQIWAFRNFGCALFLPPAPNQMIK